MPVTEAKAQLSELVRRAECGEEVILTRHGHDVVRLVRTSGPTDPATRRAILERFSRVASLQAKPGPTAARSQDFLYDEDGLPG